jgi:hypothetical protein
MTTTAPTYRKEIQYDRQTHDYAMYIDGELVGFARTYHDAEVTLDQLVFELLSSSNVPLATTATAGPDCHRAALTAAS